ncbi:hypothetical protein [Parerythrobacter aestuarii]|uniref:hypothetical protein n=1 Tax=Parerythrobacter aestuarii TaxID=3020909 RepID=UPI0024DE61E6|nr:hypothetical protein [Parerythrobacter aestuarii]
MTSNKAAAGTLVGTSIAAIGLMAMHPTGEASDTLISGVHGSLLIVLLLQASALLWILRASSFRDLNASVFFAAGTIATIAAGTLNGFVYPAMRAYQEGEIGHDIFDLVWRTNQALAELGLLGVGLGFALWSVSLFKQGDKAIAVFGLVAGLAPGVLLLSGHLGMDLPGAMLAYAIHVLWVAVLGVSRWRRS